MPKTNEITRIGTKIVTDPSTGKKKRLRVSKATGETM